MPVSTVLLDFDGTLADTLPIAFKAFQAVFRKYDGRSVTEKELVAMFGPTEDAILSANLRNRAHLEDAVRDYYVRYCEEHARGAREDPGITALLAELRQRGLKIGIVTGKSARAFRISAHALQLSGWFDSAITGDDVAKPKPDPEGIRKALGMLGASADEAVFLGDSNADIMAAKAAGMPAFAVQWLSVSQSTAFEPAPDRIFYRTGEFLDWLKAENRW